MRATSFRRSTPPPAARANHDLAELFRLDQSSARSDRVDEALALERRLCADLAGGVLIVLRAQGVGDVADCQSELRQPVGTQPDAHRVVARTEDADVGDAGHALELVEQR